MRHVQRNGAMTATGKICQSGGTHRLRRRCAAIRRTPRGSVRRDRARRDFRHRAPPSLRRRYAIPRTSARIGKIAGVSLPRGSHQRLIQEAAALCGRSTRTDRSTASGSGRRRFARGSTAHMAEGRSVGVPRPPPGRGTITIGSFTSSRRSTCPITSESRAVERLRRHSRAGVSPGNTCGASATRPSTDSRRLVRNAP